MQKPRQDSCTCILLAQNQHLQVLLQAQEVDVRILSAIIVHAPVYRSRRINTCTAVAGSGGGRAHSVCHHSMQCTCVKVRINSINRINRTNAEAILALLLQAQEVDARILSAIIAGVRRAFPFVATDDVQPLIEKHSDALFRMIHTAPFAVAVQALLLLFQLMATQNAVSDRFYRLVLE